MTVQAKILEILGKTPEMRLTDLVEAIGASRQMVHRAIRQLLESRRIEKVGTAPKTYYKLSVASFNVPETLAEEETNFLQEHFLVITETGSRLAGNAAMAHWCNRQNLPFKKTAVEFISTRKKYLGYFQLNGLINGMHKIQSTKGLDKIGLDELFYVDFYAIERFGKTRLGTLLHLAKQGQNRVLMDEIIALSSRRVHDLVTETNVDAVGFIPPTIRREVQFMKVLERKLNLALPHIRLIKVSGEIVVPQKALGKVEERVNNARASIQVIDKRKFDRVLLIDDAVGSGATMNETALKLKALSVASHVVGLAITGSFKGFEVIQEV
jgi:hypothetical protein